MLPNDSRFPELVLATTAGDVLSLPTRLRGSYGVVLVYRGSWCPYCTGQLRSFAARSDMLTTKGIKVAALSADSHDVARSTVEDMQIPFPVGVEAVVSEVAATLECYTDRDGTYLQSTGFVLDPHGNLLLAVYSSGALGRLAPTDVMAFVDRHRETTRAASTL